MPVLRDFDCDISLENGVFGAPDCILIGSKHVEFKASLFLLMLLLLACVLIAVGVGYKFWGYVFLRRVGDLLILIRENLSSNKDIFSFILKRYLWGDIARPSSW